MGKVRQVYVVSWRTGLPRENEEKGFIMSYWDGEDEGSYADSVYGLEDDDFDEDEFGGRSWSDLSYQEQQDYLWDQYLDAQAASW